MSMMHFEPFRSMRDLDRLSSQLLSGTSVPMTMPMDVWRQGDSYYVALDLPGVDPQGIDLRVERNTLTITAQRSAPFRSAGAQQQGATAPQQGQQGQQGGAGGQQGSQVLVAERPQGSFTRQLVLGEGLDTEQVKADYTDGVLHLTIPVRQSAQPRRIEVGQGGQQAGPPPPAPAGGAPGGGPRDRRSPAARGMTAPRVVGQDADDDRHGGAGRSTCVRHWRFSARRPSWSSARWSCSWGRRCSCSPALACS